MASNRGATGLPLLVAGLLVAVLLGGCIAQGAIYSHTTRPLMTNFDATPVADSGSRSDVKTVAFYVDVKWGDGGIGAIAREKGIAEIYYADIETITVLRYWKQEFVRVYGRPFAAPAVTEAMPAAPIE
jgi:hypothetical protein